MTTKKKVNMKMPFLFLLEIHSDKTVSTTYKHVYAH